MTELSEAGYTLPPLCITPYSQPASTFPSLCNQQPCYMHHVTWIMGTRFFYWLSQFCNRFHITYLPKFKLDYMYHCHCSLAYLSNFSLSTHKSIIFLHLLNCAYTKFWTSFSITLTFFQLHKHVKMVPHKIM
jgi:hypothetical protein